MQANSIHTAVIFAGGKSSRMGKDKALLPWGNSSSMASLQYRKLYPLFKHVYLSAKTEKFDFEAPVILDHYPDSSPMVALASLFETINAEAVLILSVDMPLIHTTDIMNLCRHHQAQVPTPDILVAQSPRGLEPLFGIYRRTVLPHVQSLLSQDIHRMRLLFERVKTELLYFEDSTHFSNINTPEEYQARHL